ncbi:MAG TPA: hypothetical protein DCQ31_10100, partial [Bacteroidales bacterium]|nr:hypothetical protein [Bacteroidales bacterium]
FCAFDPKTNILRYAGANNSIFIIRNTTGTPELTELKPTRNPIGIYHAEIAFKMHAVEIVPGDLLYLFSDGLIDQFSERNEKFKRIRFKKLLLEIAHQSMAEQKRIITETFNAWKGKHMQIDDLVVIGIRF